MRCPRLLVCSVALIGCASCASTSKRSTVGESASTSTTFCPILTTTTLASARHQEATKYLGQNGGGCYDDACAKSMISALQAGATINDCAHR